MTLTQKEYDMINVLISNTDIIDAYNEKCGCTAKTRKSIGSFLMGLFLIFDESSNNELKAIIQSFTVRMQVRTDYKTKERYPYIQFAKFKKAHDTLKRILAESTIEKPIAVVETKTKASKKSNKSETVVEVKDDKIETEDTQFVVDGHIVDENKLIEKEETTETK